MQVSSECRSLALCMRPENCDSVPDDVIVGIIHQTRLPDLIQWRATSRSNFVVVDTVLKKRYAAHVKPFVSDVSRLNDILRITGAIISGSVALHFLLDDEEWEPGDLDVYVADHQYDTFVDLATAPNGLGFQLEPRHPNTVDSTVHSPALEPGSLPEEHWTSGDGIAGIKEVRRFRSPTGRFIDVVRSPVRNPLAPLQAFWSTLVVNFLSPDGCGCGFPAGTFRRKGIAKSGFLTYRDHIAIDKYDTRGFITMYDPWGEHPETAEHPAYTAFGDLDAAVIYFRPRVESPYPNLPVYCTSDGCWIKPIHPLYPVCVIPDPFRTLLLTLSPDDLLQSTYRSFCYRNKP